MNFFKDKYNFRGGIVTYEEYKQGASLYQRAWSQLLQHQTFGTWIRTPREFNGFT